MGLREYLRLARIVVDAYRLGEKGVRWALLSFENAAKMLYPIPSPPLSPRSPFTPTCRYVMGDDDTFFSPHAITAFLGQYDHRTPLYLGAPSETHYQNVANTHGMAFGGGGFAISAALARMLSEGGAMDACLERHATVWGSDERVASCVGELGPISAALARMLSTDGAMDACLERHAAVWGSDERVASCVGELGIGGGGFAISVALARMLSTDGSMDVCLERHAPVWRELWVSACIAETGGISHVGRHTSPGFHQIDLDDSLLLPPDRSGRESLWAPHGAPPAPAAFPPAPHLDSIPPLLPPLPQVSLTPTPGFHQVDLGGSLFGLLMAHLLQPLLSLHHLDFVDPLLLPAGTADRAEGLAALAERMRPDPVGFAQLAVCGDG
ncbi:unnamed protein product [Closterium sp. Naga37s-1]|nr:unnamed protein product [Closterium sp. Naga37s-1]